MVGVDHLRHDPADRSLDIDGRVVPFLGQAPGQHEVAIKHAARRIGDRVLLVVTFGQHRVERSDRAAPRFAVASTLDQLGQLGEHRGWIATGGGRLADGQGDLALGLGETGQRIHQQQDVLALVAEVLGNARAVHRGAQAHQRRVIRRRSHHHRALEPLLTEDVLDELLHLPPPLTDQADHDDLGLGEACHHTQQHRLTNTSTGKQAQALAAADGKQAVDAADTDIQRLADRVTVERVDDRAVHRHPILGLHSALAVQRTAGAVKHPAEHAHAHGQAAAVVQRYHAGAGRQADDAADRHQEYP